MTDHPRPPALGIPDILETWLNEAERRAESIESGRETAISGEEVFAARFERDRG